MSLEVCDFVSVLLMWKVRSFKNMIAQTQNETIQTTTIDGIKFSFTNEEEFAMIYNEIFREKLYGFFSTTSSPVILDCGAHIGVSILFFKKLYPYAKIIA